MSRERAGWRLIYLSYPCPTCGVPAGQDCVTTSGKRSTIAHAERGRTGDRCPNCGTMLGAEDEPGQLCRRCELVRALEVERSSKYERKNP